MSYSITTKDGITIEDIPDDIAPDSKILKDQVAAERAKRGSQQPSNQQPPQQVVPEPGAARMARTPIPGEESQIESLGGGMGAVTRGAVGGALAPVTIPGDFLTSLWNLIPSETKQTLPSEAVQQVLDLIGVQKPETKAGQMIESLSSGVGGAGAGIKIGQNLAKSTSPLIAGIGESMAANPAGQVLGAAGSGLGGEGARLATEQAGGDATAQFLASLAGTVGGGAIGAGFAPKTTAVRPGAPMEQLPGLGAKVQKTPEELGALFKKAAGFGGNEARRELAREAQINPEAVKMANDLGIELPLDVFSDSTKLRQAAGLTRSVKGSTAESDFIDSTRVASQKMDELMQSLGATYNEGKPSLPVATSRILADMKATLSESQKVKNAIYDSIDEAIAPDAKVTAPKAMQTIAELRKGLGENADTQLPADFKKLEAMAKRGLTYLSLDTERKAIGDALSGAPNGYAGTNKGLLRRLYGALSEDQEKAVSDIGGPQLLEDWNKAKLLHSQEVELNDKIIDAFGRDEAGGLGTKIVSALKTAGTDSKGFNQVMDTIPENLQGDALATGIALASQDKNGFNFNNYAKLYDGLRNKNPEAYARIAKTLPEGSEKTLQAMYEVSRRLAQSSSEIERTGKSMQAITNTMNAEGVLKKLFKGVARSVGAAGGAAVGGGGPASMATVPMGVMMADALTNSGKSSIERLNAVLKSPKFQQMLVSQTEADARAAAMSPQFAAFAQEVGIPAEQRFTWLYSGLQAQNEPEKKTVSASDKAREAQRQGVKR